MKKPPPKKLPCIVLGVTGSIAAYKAAELVRLITRAAWEARVIMTRAATRFVGEITFRTLSRHPVYVDMFDEPETWCPGHIDLADRASALLIAPCTANVMAKIAMGLSDDALSATVLATRAPLIVAPAMNVGMWENPVTKQHVATLLKRKAIVIDPSRGELACGYEGRGRMEEPEAIMKVLREVLKSRNELP